MGLMALGTPSPTVRAAPDVVHLNQTTVTLYPVADAYVSQVAPTTNFGSATKLDVQNLDGGEFPDDRRSYVGFDLSTIPGEATISSAGFKAYSYNAQGLRDVYVQLRRVTSSWAENSVTWNKQPTSSAHSEVSVGTQPRMIGWDVTDLVQDHWINRKFGSDPNFGLELREPESGSYYLRSFYSADAKADKPYLVVTYNLATPTPVLELDKRLVAPSSGVARVGEVVQFQIILTNVGGTTITHLPLRDTFNPDWLEFLNANPPPDSVTSGELRWDDLTDHLGPLPPGGVIVVTLSFKALASTETQVTCNWAFVEGALDEYGYQLPQLSGYACVEISLPCSEDSYEPNNYRDQAAPINFGDEVKGIICPQHDHDHFKVVNVAANTLLRILLYDLPGDYQLALYRHDGGWITDSSNPGTSPEQITYTTPSAGTYTIRVAPAYDAYHPTRRYTLRVLTGVTKLSYLAGPPGTRLRIKGQGLFPGLGASPAEVSLYLDKVGGEELGRAMVLPDGSFDTHVIIPDVDEGSHGIIAANTYAGEVVGSIGGFFDVDYDEVPISMDLWLDDAWFGEPKPVVYKVTGDTTGSAGLTIVDVVVAISAEDDPGNVAAEVTIEGDVFGPPVRAARRNSMGGTLTEIPWEDRGGGTYGARTTLAPTARGGTYRQVVFRFRIPAHLLEQMWVRVWGGVWRLGSRVATAGPRELRLWRSIGAVIITNRHHLYDQYIENDVNWLLGQLYYHSQYWHGYSNNDLAAVVYYVDDYSTTATNWNHTAVNWASEATANTAANSIDNVIEDWFEDSRGDTPDWLLIVGDDNIIPFYRRTDPVTGDTEDDHPTVWNNHPMLNAAVSRNYFFTDNPYADMDDTDWDEGEIDLAAGRIVGPTATELSNCLLNSFDGPALDTDRAVLGTYGGRDFVLPGANNDLAEALRDERGLNLRNDTEVPVTVENDSWTEANFKAIMNLGFDIFHFQGHSENNMMEAANGNDFFASEITQANVGNAISDHRPFFYFGSACRAGMSLGTAWNDSMVYSLAHHNASGVIAAAGLSFSDWDDNEVYAAEKLANDFWQRVIRGTGVAIPMGTALRDVKRNFNPGASWQGGERKAMMEYTLFGVPWMTLPAGDGTAAHAASLRETIAAAVPVPQGVSLGPGTYAATYELDASDYQVKTVDEFHLVEVEGFVLSKGSEHPVVPAEEIELPLPPGASVLDVTVIPSGETNLGQLNIPIFIPSVDYPGAPPGHYEETPDWIGVYPPELYMLDVTSLGSYQLVRVQAIPLVYDAVSNQATLYKHLTVQVTYEAAVPVAIVEFGTDQPVYAIGDAVDVTAVIVNVGDTLVELTGEMHIEDDDGATVGTQAAASFFVPASESYPLALWVGGLEQGDHTVWLELRQSQEAIAEVSAGFGVSSGAITDFSGPDLIMPGEEALFSLRFRNDRPEAVEAVTAVSVYDGEGEPVADLPPQLLTAGSNGEDSAEFSWTADVGSGTYRADAIVVIGGHTYGPVVRTFSVAQQVYLPITLKNR
jgi:hypothetical protein